ncbi:MAG TPA: PQQ-binding-like beta-propeller repeat protein [Bryobacteraceae bacterium]|jgi:alcohol dehydrogenase (cytochrome c)
MNAEEFRSRPHAHEFRDDGAPIATLYQKLRVSGSSISGMNCGRAFIFASILRLSDNSERPEGYAGTGSGQGPYGNVGAIRAIEDKTGKIAWNHPLPSNGVQGLLSTAGGLLFGGDKSGNFVAYDAATGKTLWHSALTGSPSNGPETFLVDGQQRSWSPSRSC